MEDQPLTAHERIALAALQQRIAAALAALRALPADIAAPALAHLRQEELHFGLAMDLADEDPDGVRGYLLVLSAPVPAAADDLDDEIPV